MTPGIVMTSDPKIDTSQSVGVTKHAAEVNQPFKSLTSILYSRSNRAFGGNKSQEEDHKKILNLSIPGSFTVF